MALPPKQYQFLVSVFASLGSLLFGYDLGVIASAIASGNFRHTFGNDPNQIGAVVSIFTGGAFFGAMFAGPTGDRLGRKWTILIGAIIFCLGGALQTGATHINYLYAGRCFAGVGAQGTFIGFDDDNSLQWRLSLGIQCIPGIILALLILFFPESPRWLIGHGKTKNGLETLARLHAQGDVHDAWVQAEFSQIQASIAYDRENEAQSYIELFTDRSCFRRLVLATSIQASIQMTGVSAIQYYSVEIYSNIGIGSDDALQYQAISSVLALLAQICCMLTIDRTGRRWVLIVGNLANMVTFIIATALLAQYPPTEDGGNAGAGWGFIAMTWLYNVSFSYACGPLSWIIPAEIFDTKTRSKGVSIATMVSFAFNTMIGQTTSVALGENGIGWRWYILFIVCNFTNALWFWTVLPETAKRPLEEMRYLFTEAPLFIPTMNMSKFVAGADLDRRIQEQSAGNVKAIEPEMLEAEDYVQRV
ncbi:hypothetical protein S40285_09579 [Stachybotrys chlorohalonatus IBT 40285]|uniref:Major facilitator superfamily (MFS) profile domain-containing protein n=1 Tax=Stachybotrys chlorohalonatus (strain IBT 40285) TaxID=1283841 RepID=A0A084QX35_STAC4|nr:hypothetical protein S40285_09579 [Stachybotrys chlorohalonata IBT 40285]